MIMCACIGIYIMCVQERIDPLSCKPMGTMLWQTAVVTSQIVLAMNAVAEDHADKLYVVKNPAPQKGVYAACGLDEGSVSIFPLTTNCVLKENPPAGSVVLSIKFDSELKAFKACLLPKVVFPVLGKSGDKSRGAYDKDEVKGFVPFFWMIQETDVAKAINMKKASKEVTMSIGSAKHIISVPYLTNSRKICKDEQLCCKKGALIVPSTKKAKTT
jgi:hypothetical protein